MDGHIEALYRAFSQWLDAALRALPGQQVVAAVEVPGGSRIGQHVFLAGGVVRAVLLGAGVPFVSLSPLQMRLELGCAAKTEKPGMWAACGGRVTGFDRLPTEHTRDAAAVALAALLRRGRLGRLGLLTQDPGSAG